MTNTIRKQRESLGLSQRDLSSMTGIPRSTVFGLENGSNTKFSTLVKIVNTLNNLKTKNR